MFLASNDCCTRSEVERVRYDWVAREVSGVKPGMKKWRRGNGMRFTASLRRSQLSWPGKRMEHVQPDMVEAMSVLRSP